MNIKQASLVLGPVTGALLGLALTAAGLDPKICWTAAITLNTAVWWIFESIPIPAASLLPFAAFPLAGVLTHQQASAALGNTVILLLMGAFMLSKAIEKSGVHERFALGMIRLVGGGCRDSLENCRESAAANANIGHVGGRDTGCRARAPRR